MRPLVSVIIPLYNAENYISQAIGSVFSQTYKPLELIVVDDGSTDGSVDTVKQWRNVKLFTQENRGAGIARNIGVQHSEGNYVAFLDADDIWLPGKIEREMEVLRLYPKVSIVATKCKRINERGEELALGDEKIKITHDSPVNLTRKLLMQGNPICMSSVLMRKDVFEEAGGFASDFRLSLDYDLWIRLASSGNLFFIISDPLTIYRERPESLLHGSLEKEYGAQFAILDRHRAQYSRVAYRKRKAKIYYDWADSAFWAKNRGAWSIALNSIFCNPLSPEPYLLIVKKVITGLFGR